MKQARATACVTLAALLGLQAVAPAGAAPPTASPVPAEAGSRVGGSNALPALGESSDDGLSPAAERALGDRVMRDIWRDPDYFEDPVLDEYVDGMWQRLLAAARRRGDISADLEGRFAWQAFLVRDRAVNAFALPGGYVGVNLGLIALTGTRDEIASVLAHELSHVSQRHIVRSMGIQQRQSLVGIAAMVLGAVAASRNPQAAQAIMTTGQAVAVQGQLNFSRDMEREADRVGFGVLTAADFDGAGMVGMFERLERSARLTDDGSFPYLRTHPLTAERIGEARSRASTVASTARAAGTGGAVRGDVLHAVMRARARVLMDPRAIAWERLVAEARASNGAAGPRQDASAGAQSDAVQGLASAYAAALIAAQQRDGARVDQALTWMAQRQRELGEMPPAVRQQLVRLQAETALLRGETRLADAALEALDGDASRATELLRARRALLPGTDTRLVSQEAAALQTRVAAAPQDAQAWALLAQLWQRQGQPLRALRAEAEAAAARGDLPGAVERLRAGQRAVRSGSRADFVEASVIDARLHVIEAQLQARMREEAER